MLPRDKIYRKSERYTSKKVLIKIIKNLTGHVGGWTHLISYSCPVHGGGTIFVLLRTGEAGWIFDLFASKTRLARDSCFMVS